MLREYMNGGDFQTPITLLYPIIPNMTYNHHNLLTARTIHGDNCFDNVSVIKTTTYCYSNNLFSIKWEQ
jgi:hypothetical protein